MTRAQIDAVFFDLDGTLIDTAADMGGALNRLLSAHAQPNLAINTIRPYVSDGANALIKRGFKEAIGDTKLQALREQYLNIYREHLADESCLFAKMDETLNAIEEKKLAWGGYHQQTGVVNRTPAKTTWPSRALHLCRERRYMQRAKTPPHADVPRLQTGQCSTAKLSLCW